MNRTETDVYYKDTHTGQYCDFSSHIPWPLKISWVKALLNRSHKICSTKSKFRKQLSKIKRFMSWNNYPKHVVKSVTSKHVKHLECRKNSDTQDDENKVKIYITIPYLGDKGMSLVKSLVNKLKRYCKEDTKFVLRYETKKSAMFCPTKDKIPTDQKANIIYSIKCPGCHSLYVGKTDRCFITRMKEHGSRPDQPMYQHLYNCAKFHEYVQLFNLPCLFNENLPETNYKQFIYNSVLDNAKIIDSNNRNWSQLCYLESYYIKHLSPSINAGLKATKELQLFY